MNGMANPSGISPLEFNVLILQEEVENKVGNIWLPDEARDKMQWAETRGRVIDIAAAAFTEFGSGARVGETVIFSRHAGRNVKGVDGVEYKLVKDKDVLAVVRGAA